MLLDWEAVDVGHQLINPQEAQVRVEEKQPHRGGGIQEFKLRRMLGYQRLRLHAFGVVIKIADHA